MLKRLIFTVFISLSPWISSAQLYPDHRFKTIENGDTLLYPFAGGLNSPVMAELDLNGDGINDLLILEKTTGRVLTFLNTGLQNSSPYIFAPQYINLIPPLSEWVRSYDYDCDGDLDLFTYTVSYTYNVLGDQTIKVYRNDYTSTGGLAFTLIANELLTTYGSVLKVLPASPVNLSAFTDVDGDGDMDILTFSLSSNFLEYHRNFSMDSTGSCDGFMFHLDPDCWGQFKLSGVNNSAILNSNCQNIPDNAALHSGSVLTALDQGCDGDIDLINGDLLGTNLLYLENGGTSSNALITSQDTIFPSYDVPVNYFNLPGAYYLDADNDGNKDMLVSGFGIIGEDFNNLLFYKNTTGNCSNNFQYQQSRFLVNNMIDVGTASVPVFFDVDHDGLMDLVVGNEYYYSIFTSQKVSHLAWYKNTGTLNAPVFTLMNRDFADVSSLGILGAYPAFGDLDNDGLDDMLIGDDNGDLVYYHNAGGTPYNFVFTAAFYQGIDVGANSMPQIIDIDRDGLKDLLIGERSGVLNYYKNTGTASSPVFTLISSNFGGVNVIQPMAVQGNSAPVLYDNSGSYELYVGAENGYIYKYVNIDGNLGGTFTLADTAYGGIYEPHRATISIYDIDNDGLPDVITGNHAGGLKLYTHYNPGSITDYQTASSGILLYPVPVKDALNILLPAGLTNSKSIVEIIDVEGRVIIREQYNSTIQVNTSGLAQGIYIVRVISGNHLFLNKFIR